MTAVNITAAFHIFIEIIGHIFNGTMLISHKYSSHKHVSSYHGGTWISELYMMQQPEM